MKSLVILQTDNRLLARFASDTCPYILAGVLKSTYDVVYQMAELQATRKSLSMEGAVLARFNVDFAGAFLAVHDESRDLQDVPNSTIYSRCMEGVYLNVVFCSLGCEPDIRMTPKHPLWDIGYTTGTEDHRRMLIEGLLSSSLGLI